MKFLVLATVAISTIATAETVNRGGGFLDKDGVIVSAFEATPVKTQAPSFDIQSIPGFELLLEKLEQTNLSLDLKSKWKDSLFPINGRRYLIGELESNDRKRFEAGLKKKFIEMGACSRGLFSRCEVKLFALTNKETKSTTLIPEFLSLDPIKQAVILFHELVWLTLHRKSNAYDPSLEGALSDVVDLEVAFERMIRNSTAPLYDFEFYRLVARHFNSDKRLVAALKRDVETGTLKPTSYQNGSAVFDFKELFPALNAGVRYGDIMLGGSIIPTSFRVAVLDLMRQNPDSHFFAVLAEEKKLWVQSNRECRYDLVDDEAFKYPPEQIDKTIDYSDKEVVKTSFEEMYKIKVVEQFENQQTKTVYRFVNKKKPVNNMTCVATVSFE